MYEKEYTVRYSEVTQAAVSSLSALVSYFQDTTMFHSDTVGQGIGDLMEQKMAWLLASWRIQIKRYPSYAEKITARTWATKFAGVYGYRDFSLSDEQGNVIALASSIWIQYDAGAQKMKRVTQEIADVYGAEGNFAFTDGDEGRIRPPKSYKDIGTVEVRRRDLDTNNHVNNIHYIDYALDALPEGLLVRELRVSYKKAAVLGDVIHIGLHTEGETYTCVLHDGVGGIYTVLQFN